MRILFMGTPDFAVPCLEEIINMNHTIVGVFTQPDRPSGRGKKLTASPVKVKALENNIPVFQPERIKDDEFVLKIKEISPDCIVVVAYGQILPKAILEIPKLGCINVHASLLPKYRGAAPINWSIIKGEKTTGVTTMYMEEGLDTGDMIFKKETEIGNKTAGELLLELSIMGARLLNQTLEALDKGQAPRIKQQDNESSYAPILKKEMGQICWEKDARDIYNLVRGLNPWPTAYTKYKGQNLKIWKAKYLDVICKDTPGEIINVGKDGISICTGKGILIIEELQFPNGKRMLVSEYLKGNEIQENLILGE